MYTDSLSIVRSALPTRMARTWPSNWFRREANELLDQAISAAPAAGRPELVREQRELNAR